MNCLIGLAVGLIGALLHQTIDLISDFKWLWAKQYLEEYVQVTKLRLWAKQYLEEYVQVTKLRLWAKQYLEEYVHCPGN